MLKRKQLRRKNCILPLMADPEYDIDEWLNEKGEENNNIIFIVGTRNMDEITAIICTSATEIEMAMKDRDKCKYACEKNNMGTVQKDKKYIPFVLGMEAGDIGYISKEEANSILYLVYTQKGRIFELSFETTIPYTASIAAADDLNPNWISANHCQTGSTILHYTVSYRPEGQKVLDVVEAQRKRILQITNYDRILKLCKETNKKLLCDRDPEIQEHIKNLAEIKKFADNQLIVYKTNKNALIAYDKVTEEKVKLIDNSLGVSFDYKNIISASLTTKSGISIFRNLNTTPFFNKFDPSVSYEDIMTLNHDQKFVTYITVDEDDDVIYNLTEYNIDRTITEKLCQYTEESVSKNDNNLDIFIDESNMEVKIINPVDFKNGEMNYLNINISGYIKGVSSIMSKNKEYLTIIVEEKEYTGDYEDNYADIVLYRNNKYDNKKLPVYSTVNSISIANNKEFVYMFSNKIYIANLETMENTNEIVLKPRLSTYMTNYIKMYNDKIIFLKKDGLYVLINKEDPGSIQKYAYIVSAQAIFMSDKAIENL